jgi:hypothetical protein
MLSQGRVTGKIGDIHLNPGSSTLAATAIHVIGRGRRDTEGTHLKIQLHRQADTVAVRLGCEVVT